MAPLLPTEQPHVRLASRTGGNYFFPMSHVEDLRHFFRYAAPTAQYEGLDLCSVEILLERSDVVAMFVLDELALAAVADEAAIHRQRQLQGDA